MIIKKLGATKTTVVVFFHVVFVAPSFFIVNVFLLTGEICQPAITSCLKHTWARYGFSVFENADLFKNEATNLVIEASLRVAFLNRHHLRELGGVLSALPGLETINLRVYVDDININKAQLQELQEQTMIGP